MTILGTVLGLLLAAILGVMFHADHPIRHAFFFMLGWFLYDLAKFGWKRFREARR